MFKMMVCAKRRFLHASNIRMRHGMLIKGSAICLSLKERVGDRLEETLWDGERMGYAMA